MDTDIPANLRNFRTTFWELLQHRWSRRSPTQASPLQGSEFLIYLITTLECVPLTYENEKPA